MIFRSKRVKKFGEVEKFLRVSKKKGHQKYLGKYGQKKATLDISRRYMD